MSLLKMVFTCLLVLSFGIFLVYLESEKTRMEHKILRWHEVQEEIRESMKRELFFQTRVLQKRLHGGSLLEDLRKEKQNFVKWTQ